MFWHGGSLGRPVCHVIPPTVRPEKHRRVLWHTWSQSECLLDFGEILWATTGLEELPMQGQHHYAGAGGLIMATALGRFFHDHPRLIDAIHGRAPHPSTAPGTIYWRGAPSGS
jgi:hypothetical protein